MTQMVAHRWLFVSSLTLSGLAQSTHVGHCVVSYVGGYVESKVGQSFRIPVSLILQQSDSGWDIRGVGRNL